MCGIIRLRYAGHCGIDAETSNRSGNGVCRPERENRLRDSVLMAPTWKGRSIVSTKRRTAATSAVRSLVLFVLSLTSLRVSASADAAGPLRLSLTISLPQVKGGFDLMAVDLAGRRLFLAAEDNNSVEVLDLAAGKALRSVGGFAEPKWVVYRPESKRLYVSNGGDGSVRVLDAESFAEIKRFAFREKANNLRYDEATRELFVGVGKTSGEIGIVDTARDVVSGAIALADFPKQFELDGERILVNVPKANHVAVLDRATRKQTAAWPVAAAKENVPMGFDRAQRRLFIGCEAGKLAVLNADSGAAVADLAISAEPDGVYYDAARKRIYVPCGAGSIDVVTQRDADHYERTARIPTAPGAATGLFIPQLNLFCLAVPQRDYQTAELRVYSVVD